MQPDDRHTQLSVRADAQRIVDPDQVTIFCSASAPSGSRDAVRAGLRVTLTGLTEELVALGGEVLTMHTMRAPLTWSTFALHTHREHDYDERTGQHGPTGRYTGSAEVRITLRDFTLLGHLEAVVTRHDAVDVQSVRWSVDRDNAGWALVRADAIEAAVAKGQDYAAALGGSVVRVDHVADAGLLGGAGTSSWAEQRSGVVAAAAFGDGSQEDASLDPVPQTLTAVIEARLTAVISVLPRAGT